MNTRSEWFREPRLQAILKVMVVVGYFAVWWQIYDQVNRYASDPSRTIQRRSPGALFPGLIQPWTVLIYVPGGALLAVIPFVYHRTWRGIGWVLAAYTLSAIVAFSCYLVWPLSMHRGINMGRDHEAALLRWVYNVDMPANCFPSFHAIFATFGALFVAQGGASRPMAAGTWLLAMIVMVTTVTTGQHYFTDAPAGALLAFLVFLSLERIPAALRKEPAKPL